MYISPNPEVNHGTYFNLVRDIVTAAPSTWPIIEDINNNILSAISTRRSRKPASSSPTRKNFSIITAI